MTSDSKINRPLSPHLSIYKPQFTSVLSIMHRITGVALILSSLLVISWFLALSLGPNQFYVIEILYDLIIVRIILALSVWALWYHSCNGVRHLVWDLGYGLGVEWINLSSYLVVFGSVCLTLSTLCVGWYYQ